MMRFTNTIISILLICAHSICQERDSLPAWSMLTDSIELTASRLNESLIGAQYTQYQVNDVIIRGRQAQISLKESLDLIPGIFCSNAENHAQDLRLSIRGFGARASFGIRGIKILIDGIPETTPDGITQVDNIDVSTVKIVKVVNSGMASLYGNSSSGVVELLTDEVPDSSHLTLTTMLGYYGLGKFVSSIGYRFSDRWGFITTFSGFRLDGYRIHSETRHYNLNAKVEYNFDNKSKLKVLFNYVDSPKANDPGGLTESEYLENRRAAAPQNLNFLAGENVKQGKLAVNYLWQRDVLNYFRARAYLVARDFANTLPFRLGGIVELNRFYYGGGIEYSISGSLNRINFRMLTGLDVEEQRDDRYRFNNLMGLKTDNVFHQLELFRSLGIYNRLSFSTSSVGLFNFSHRLDINQIAYQDIFNAKPLLIDKNKLTWSPSLGWVFLFSKNESVYFNYSRSFDMPSLIELSNNPFADSGFNPNLNPQYANHIEIGYRNFIQNILSLNLTLFYIRTFDEIFPFELPDYPQRVFYKNSGSGKRYGVELQIQNHFFNCVDFIFSASAGRYLLVNEFNKMFEIPGVPSLSGAFMAIYNLKNQHISLSMRYNHGTYFDDVNTLKVNEHAIFNFQYSFSLPLPKVRTSLQLGWQNIFNQKYFSNIRVNAASYRHYEPAMGSNAYVRARVEI